MTAVILLCLLVATAATRISVARSAVSNSPQRKQQPWMWRWDVWLPAKWVRIGRCETHLTWTWNSGTYQGAFGFHYASWDRFRRPQDPPEAYQATPWAQYQVALRIWRRYGLSGWGCRNA